MKRAFGAALAGAFALSACTSGQVGQTPAATVLPVSSSQLQLAVGIATLVDPLTGGAVEGLNVVETFRNTSGLSATTTNTPTLTGPAGAFGAPAINELTGLTLPQQQTVANEIVAANTAQPTPTPFATPSPKPSGKPTPTPTPTPTATAPYAVPFPSSASDVFGSVTGAFGYGLAPDNLADTTLMAEYQLLAGTGANCTMFTQANDSVRYQTQTVPISAPAEARGPTQICPPLSTSKGATAAGQIPQTQFYGGPPLWPSPAGYGLPIGFLGWSSGFSIFVPCSDATCATPKNPPAGNYGLNVGVALGDSSSGAYTSLTAAATLPAASVAAPLPVVSPPSVMVESDGTGYVNLTVPADPRIYETIVYLTVPDCGEGYLPPAGNEPTHYYSIITKSPGPQTLFLSNLGPPNAAGTPTHTFCVASDLAAIYSNLSGNSTGLYFGFTISAVSFDYPAYEASFPADRDVRPTIANAQSGTADLSMSAPHVCQGYKIPTPGKPSSC